MSLLQGRPSALRKVEVRIQLRELGPGLASSELPLDAAVGSIALTLQSRHAVLQRRQVADRP